MTTLASYRTTATATRNRRQAKGCYAKPTPEQDAAMKKLLTRGGEATLTVAEVRLLATHPDLTVSQRAKWLVIANAL